MTLHKRNGILVTDTVERMLNYYADSSEEKHFKCAHCGTTLFGADNLFLPSRNIQVVGDQLSSYLVELEHIHISDSLEIVCTQCGQHLGLVSFEEAVNEDITIQGLS
ncbi:peptide-methionine (R)-S-oxide reductase [Candidatus Gottesmanbacteria bacterium]|nr:peptide-methionine (R)-S-oxide reductase [Candidatus Gottesmanbacteria bacterium]